MQYTAPTTLDEVTAISRQYRLPANTDIGQHFLIDHSVVEESIAAAGVTENDTVVEVGPGFGVLTQALCETAKRVVAIELDTRFAPIIEALQAQYSNLEVHYGDALKLPWNEIGVASGEYKVVTNLPYQITSQFFRHRLTQQPYPQSITALIQKEVAERMVAKPGKLSVLGVSVQLYAQAEIIRTVGPEAFSPPPRVESSIIHVSNIRTSENMAQEYDEALFSLVRAGFAQKRKTLVNNLKNWQKNGRSIDNVRLKQWLEQQGLSASARAQELSIEQWRLLLDNIQ